MPLYQIKLFRRFVLPILKTFNPGKIKITHHYTRSAFFLDFFKHKGYWFHGAQREHETMNLFKRLIKSDDVIIEVGGHIGYLTSYFAMLASKGIVYVFEPGPNNLPYLKQNIKGIKNIELIEKAVSDNNGTANFYIENLTGQNNSLISDYEFYDINKKNAFVESEKEEISVDTITLDSFCNDFSVKPDFIKIDIEGAELMALNGMLSVLQNWIPMVMVEITENWKLIYNIFKSEGYTLFNEQLQELNIEDNHIGNTFCFNLKKHSIPQKIT